MNYNMRMDRLIFRQRGLRTNSIGYMPGLDGLRALAVLAVIAYHLNLAWAPGGLLGVCLFFVLSGYLITNILLTQWENYKSIDLKNFWLRRAKRLLPALFVMLAGVVLWVALCAPERLATLKQEALAAVFYVSNWYLILHHVSYFESFGPPSPLGHLWSLAVEEQFYLIWPLVLGLGLRCLRQRKWLIRGTVALAGASAVAMALLYMPGNDPSRVYYGTDTRAFALLAGAVLAMLWPSRNMKTDISAKNKITLDVAGCLGLAIVLVMIYKSNQYQTFLYRGGLLLFSVAAACVVAVLAHPASFLGKVFGWGPLRWLGECSYGIYLWHYPVIVLTNPVVNTQGLELSRALWQIALSIILAALSRYLVEEPIRYGWRQPLGRRTVNLHRRQKPLKLNLKISGSIFLIFLVLLTTTNGCRQTSAKVSGQNQVTNQTAQVDKKPVQSPTKKAVSGQKTATAKKNVKNSVIKGEQITAIGDSLMLDLKPALQKLLPGIAIDAKIGRQMYQANDVIDQLKKTGKLKGIVIIELGTNGSFTEKQLIKTLESLKGAKKIVLMNTRVPKPWETVVNETLAKVAKSYPNIKLLDWYSASGGHDEYFYQDGVHLNKTGAAACAKIITKALN